MCLVKINRNSPNESLQKITKMFFKSNLWRCFFKKGVLKNFWIFTRKHLFWSLFSIKLPIRKAYILVINYHFSVSSLYWLRHLSRLAAWWSLYKVGHLSKFGVSNLYEVEHLSKLPVWSLNKVGHLLKLPIWSLYRLGHLSKFVGSKLYEVGHLPKLAA